MKSYLAKLAADYDKSLEWLASPRGEEGQKKITGKLRPGARVAWCFEEDVEMWKQWKEPMPNPKDWPYHGFLLPFPETDGRCKDMDPEHVCVVVTDYPMEKENPVTDWATLACILESHDLHRFYVFENVTLA